MTVTRRPQRKPTNFYGMLTQAPRMLELFRTIERVGRSEVTVLIRGASGTGKELVARALHAESPRAKGPFQAINCAVLTPELLASELFGHVRGAFTGAVRDHRGLFERAHRGTMFLDEVAELPLDLQARLLRVLEERSFTPVGGTRSVRVDVRLASATLRSLRRLVEAHRFREDLMYRLRVVPLFLPALVERDGDVEALTWHFVDHFSKHYQRNIEAISRSAYDALLAYSWPGNIRELKNVIEHAFVVGEGPVLRLQDLPPELRGEGPVEAGAAPNLLARERQRLLEALDKSGGKRGPAAELLAMSRSTLWRKLREHGLVER